MAVENPPSDEPKSERFNMFISKAELAAIDEWAWKHRIRSKSEAVRRLIQIGLRSPDLLLTIGDAATKASRAAQSLNEAWSELANLPDHEDPEADANSHSEAYRRILDRSENVGDEASLALEEVSDALLAVLQFISDQSIEQAISDANSLSHTNRPTDRDEFRALRKKLRAKFEKGTK